jgi:hypothetical protein
VTFVHTAGKLRRVLDLCTELDIASAPACIAGVWIVPLQSWYSARWDREPDIPGAMPVNKVHPSPRGLAALLRSQKFTARHLAICSMQMQHAARRCVHGQTSEAGVMPRTADDGGLPRVLLAPAGAQCRRRVTGRVL